MKREIFMRALKEMGLSYGWKLLGKDHENFKRLSKLAEQFEEADYSVKVVQSAIAQARVKSPKWCPTDSEINESIKEQLEVERRMSLTQKQYMLPENYERWKKKMVACGIKNKENHEAIIEGKEKPVFADPDIALGKLTY